MLRRFASRSGASLPAHVPAADFSPSVSPAPVVQAPVHLWSLLPSSGVSAFLPTPPMLLPRVSSTPSAQPPHPATSPVLFSKRQCAKPAGRPWRVGSISNVSSHQSGALLGAFSWGELGGLAQVPEERCDITAGPPRPGHGFSGRRRRPQGAHLPSGARCVHQPKARRTVSAARGCPRRLPGSLARH